MTKKMLIILLSFSHTLFSYINQEQALVHFYIDFEQSMHEGFNEEKYTKCLDEKPQKTYLSILKTLYEQNHFLRKLHERPIKAIPRIIHQIWLGSPLPKRYKKFQETWKKYHPDWKYKLWTESDLKNFKLINQKAFDKSANYAEKANIWRYEILERFGGLYVDTDFKCLQSFDLIHDFYEFYAGIATINRLTLINNGLIASIPGHPILKECIKNINKQPYGHGQLGRNGTIFFGHMVVQTCLNNKSMNLHRILILPPTYFYPWPGKDAPKHFNEYLLESSFAVHFWDCSWVFPVPDDT
ncbi:MAG: hypothetical protein HY860_02585 [Chlamydiales bacterium]|nr:hypothetical protein [Chlamydiales bacterium]